MTANSERQRAGVIYTKSNFFAKPLYTKSEKLFKKQYNLRYVFIYKKQDTLWYAIFQENVKVGIYIQKSRHFALREAFIYKKPDTSQKARQFASRFYIQKSGHFALRSFSLNF